MPQLLSRSLARKINFFIALLMAIFALVVASAVYFDTKNYNTQKKEYNAAIAENIFESNMNMEKSSLLQTLVAVKNNKEYIKAFKEGDRQKLLAVTESFFAELKKKHNITHFYFISPDKKCFLRVHKPEQYGDTINRVTLARAIETQEEFVALEMGKNFFSLRAVTPIFDNGKLLGYMELGREIEHFFGLFKKQTGFDVSLLLDDKYVDKYSRSVGSVLVPEGKKVGGFVILNSSNPKLAETIIKSVALQEMRKNSFEDFKIGSTVYSCYSKDIYDANSETAGRLLISSENTQLHNAAFRQYLFIIITTIVVVGLMAYGIKLGIDKEILEPLEKIRNGVINFFDFMRGEAKSINYIEPMSNNEIGSIANTLNESMEETMRILEKNKKNEAYLLQRSRVVALGEMISNIAHHWRQPLNIVSVAAQDMRFAKKDGELTDEYFENAVAKIVETAKGLSETLNKFSHFYKQPKNKEYFCVEDELRRSLDFFKEVNFDFDVQIEFAPQTKHTIKNYKSELYQAVLNILKNSKEAIIKHGIKGGKITVSAVPEMSGGVKISITDNGGGVDAKELERIFDPYYTTKYKTNDVGLGLYLSKMMVEKNMGGILRAQNDEEGLRIEIELPSMSDSEV